MTKIIRIRILHRLNWKATILKKISSIQKPVVLNFKMVLEQSTFIVVFEHGFANRVDICNYRLMILAYAEFLFHKRVRACAAVSNTLLREICKVRCILMAANSAQMDSPMHWQWFVCVRCELFSQMNDYFSSVGFAYLWMGYLQYWAGWHGYY